MSDFSDIRNVIGPLKVPEIRALAEGSGVHWMTWYRIGKGRVKAPRYASVERIRQRLAELRPVAQEAG